MAGRDVSGSQEARAGAGAQLRFAQVADAFRGVEGVNLPGEGKGFGSTSLRSGGKIFAMLSSRSQFVVKLPATRVSALVVSGDGERYDPGRGRMMQEWLAVKPTSTLDWVALAREALQFVGAAQR